MRFTLKKLRPLTFILSVLVIVSSCDVLSVLNSNAKPSAQVVSTSIDGLDLQGLSLNFGVEIKNPYNVSIPLTQLTYALATEGQAFLSGQLDEKPGNIPAMGSQVVQIPVRINFKKAMQLVGSIKPGTSIPYRADLTISVDALGIGNFDIPLSKSGSVPVPDLPEVEVSSVEWEEVSLNKAKAQVKLKMKNTNDFALQFKQMDYNFSLGGNNLATSQMQMTNSVAAGGESELIIPLEFAPMSLGMGVLNLIKGSGADYELKGDLKVGTDFGPLDFPLSNTGKVNFNR
jgi:LEA14-like dessication related protein